MRRLAAALSTAALRALDDGKGVALCTVIGAHGSTPRHLGARMAVADDGTQWGTIGGGKIEQVVVDAAKQVAAGAEPRVVRQHLVRDLAMCCGGAMTIAITPGAPSRGAIDRAATLTAAHVVETPIDGAPLIVREVCAGDPQAHRPEVLDGKLVERLGATERAIIFGYGHVARALGPLLHELGFAGVTFAAATDLPPSVAR